jgi:hypothetical protein
VDGDISGSITAHGEGIGNVSTSYGTISASLTADGSIGNITAFDDISGAITAESGIGDITAANGDITGDINGNEAGVGNVTAGGDLSGTISADGDIGNVTVGKPDGGDSSEDITSNRGNIGTILVYGEIDGDVKAHGSIGAMWSREDMNGTISSGSGSLLIESGSAIDEDVHGKGDMFLEAGGEISGSVNTFGNINVSDWGNIADELNTTLNIDEVATGNITGNATTSQGSIYEAAAGNIQNTRKASINVITEAKGTISGKATAQSVVSNTVGNSSSSNSGGINVLGGFAYVGYGKTLGNILGVGGEFGLGLYAPTDGPPTLGVEGYRNVQLGPLLYGRGGYSFIGSQGSGNFGGVSVGPVSIDTFYDPGEDETYVGLAVGEGAQVGAGIAVKGNHPELLNDAIVIVTASAPVGYVVNTAIAQSTLASGSLGLGSAGVSGTTLAEAAAGGTTAGGALAVGSAITVAAVGGYVLGTAIAHLPTPGGEDVSYRFGQVIYFTFRWAY